MDDSTDPASKSDSQLPAAEPTSAWGARPPVPSAPPGTLWAQYDTSKPRVPRPPTRFTRILEAIAWIVAGGAVLFFGRVFPILNGSRMVSAYEAGAIAGTITAAVFVGVIVRWIFVRARGGRLRSPWILVVAVVVLLTGLGRELGAAGLAASGPPRETYLTIEPPFSLGVTTTAEQEQIRTASNGAFGDFELRRLMEGDVAVGFLVVSGPITYGPESLNEFEAGFETGEGSQAQQVVVGGNQTILGTTRTGAAAFWIEPPYLLAVYALDEESARVLAESVMTSYDN